MLKTLRIFLLFLSIAVFPQNAATLHIEIKEPCFKLSVVSLDNLEKNRIVSEKRKFPKVSLFKIKTNVKFPLAYAFVCENEDSFVISSRLFTVASRDNLNFKIDKIENNKQYFPITNVKSTILEDQKEFYLAFPDTINLYSSNNETYRTNLVNELPLFEKYAKQHPDSYMLFWYFKQYFEENSWLTGYNDSYLRTFKNLSPEIQNSIYGKNLFERIVNASRIKEGMMFPKIKLNDNNLFKLGAKYTLLDFWATYCQPCMEKLPTYKVLYNQYKNKGFQIISISGDRRKDIVKWKKIIQDNQLNWQHVIDIDGNDSKKYNITTFPSTFLLDSKGRIIKMNFSTDELKLFLKENIE